MKTYVNLNQRTNLNGVGY